MKLMRQRSTTPVSKHKRIKKLTLVAAFLMAVATPLGLSQSTNAVDYQGRIDAIQRQIDRYQAEASKLSKKGDSLQKKLNAITNEKRQIQASLELSQAQYDKLQDDIAKTENDIQTNRGVLGDTMANMYIDGNISPIEMLASSNNIGDYLDKQEYQATVRDELARTIDTIKALKEKLQKQQENVKTVLDNQTRARDALAKKEQEQQQLLSETRGREGAYQKLSEKSRKEKERLMDEQAAAIAAASSNNGGVKFVGGGSGGYPWHSGNCVMWGMYSTGGADGNGGDGWGYGCRQCASYAAWKVGQHTGIIPTNLGHANQFPYAYPASRKGTTAKKNSLGVISAGAYGHVVWVESDPDASGFITVSQYNANYGGGWGNFSRVRVHYTTYDTYIYF